MSTTGGRHKPNPEVYTLSNSIRTFNDQFGEIEWTDVDRVHRLVTEDIPAKVAADQAYQNALKNSDKQNAKIEHDKALLRAVPSLLKDDPKFFNEVSDIASLRR